MYDVAKSIQEERRHRAHVHRVAAHLPRERSLGMGRFKVTLKRDARSLPAS